MKARFFIFCLLLPSLGTPGEAAGHRAPASVQPGPGRPTLDETARLMQDYMVRRSEWIELRRTALDKVKAAKDEAEKKQHREKLAEDEKPVLARVAEAARAYRAAKKAEEAKRGEGKSRN